MWKRHASGALKRPEGGRDSLEHSRDCGRGSDFVEDKSQEGAVHDAVRALQIDVTTQGSTVTLSGRARSNVERERAVRLARETDGVSNVVDRIDVK